MDDDFYSHEEDESGGDNLFLWTIFILLLIGCAFASWIGSIYVFGHPERPAAYKFLTKIGKIEPPKRFELTAAPSGEFLSPQKLFDRYSKMSKAELKKENQLLIRNYINNYRETKKPVPYVIGRYNILDNHPLTEKDIVKSGVVALAQAEDFPQIVIEHIYSSTPENVPMLQSMLQTGLDIKLERTMDLSAVVHVERLFDGRLQLTVIPLLYGSYALKDASGGFSLEPPTDLNMEAERPIVKTEGLQDAFRNYAEWRRKRGGSRFAKRDAANPSPTPESTLVRVEPAESPAETTVAAETPRPEASPTPAPVAAATPAKPAATPVAVAAALATPVPTPAAVPSPKAAPPVSPQGVPLQPFLQAAPTPAIRATGGSWRTFRPGQMPKGRLVDVPELQRLAERGVGGERLYLPGEFVVTAAAENRAVMRSSGGSALTDLSGQGAVRIIAEFPAGAVTPSEGSTVGREESRPFQVTDVRRGADGQVNVYVREITTPE